MTEPDSEQEPGLFEVPVSVKQPKRLLADTPDLVADGPHEDTAWWIATTNTPPQCVAPGGVVLMDRDGSRIDDRAVEAADHARTVLAQYHDRIGGSRVRC